MRAIFFRYSNDLGLPPGDAIQLVYASRGDNYIERGEFLHIFGEAFGMSQAIVDPAELRRFAQTLKKFSGELASQTALLQRQLTALGESWRDQEHIKFVAEFQQQLPVMARFADAAGQYTSFLVRKAERAEEYLRQR